ncbi:hypothetical protein [Thauera phenolivorans]|uniref:hypothetical protein n=1 Tax=Thauera phenolivorans TaxID=1792543 RepID=UPI000839DCE7|nr:hypothetical protein [Thauera phenolivorans]
MEQTGRAPTMPKGGSTPTDIQFNASVLAADAPVTETSNSPRRPLADTWDLVTGEGDEAADMHAG